MSSPAPPPFKAREPDAAFAPAPAVHSRLALNLPLPPERADAAAAVRQALEAIAPFVTQATLARQDATYREVVDRIIESTPIRQLDAARAALEQRAIAAVFDGTEWLTAEQVGRLRDPKARNPHNAVHRWRTEGKLFGLSKGGLQWYPRYAFDESLDPLPVVGEVIAALQGWSPFRLAAWFDSTNSHLGGRRPRELLTIRAADVVAAAREHARGPLHG